MCRLVMANRYILRDMVFSIFIIVIRPAVHLGNFTWPVTMPRPDRCCPFECVWSPGIWCCHFSAFENRIEEIKKEPKWNPPAQVDEYSYNGKSVFLFSSNCCDQYNMLYNENCETICAPSGGLTGKGDNKCSDFFNTAKYVKLVWKDSR